MKIIGSLLINTVAVLVSAYLIAGVTVDSVWTALLVAIVMAVLNVSLKPFLMLLTLPITILTLGLFAFFINILLLYLVDAVVGGFEITSLLAAIFFSILLSLTSSVLNKVFG